MGRDACRVRDVMGTGRLATEVKMNSKSRWMYVLAFGFGFGFGLTDTVYCC